MPHPTRQKRIDAMNIHLGQRVRLRRLLSGKTLDEVGTSLGISGQQVQKYEIGANSISSSMLFSLGQLFDTKIDYFFRETPVRATTVDELIRVTSFVGEGWMVHKSFAGFKGLELARNFSSISDDRVRYSVLQLVKGLSAAPPQRP